MKDEYFESLTAEHFPGSKVLGSEKLAGGVSATVTLLHLQLSVGEKARIVLREHGPSHCGHPVDLEFHLLRSLSERALIVPNALAWGVADDLHRYPYILLDYLDGSTGIPASAVENCIRTMAAELAAVHECSIDLLPRLPLRVDPLPELLHFLSDEAEWDGLRSALTRMRSTKYTGKVVLLHGDYWPQNIVWRGGAFVGILDWEDAAIGDPLSDVACACLELSYTHGEWGARCFLDAYRERREIDVFRFTLWQAYVAAAGAYSMANWGLEPSRELSMRQTATDSIRAAARTLGD